MFAKVLAISTFATAAMAVEFNIFTEIGSLFESKSDPKKVKVLNKNIDVSKEVKKGKKVAHKKGITVKKAEPKKGRNAKKAAPKKARKGKKFTSKKA